MLHIHNSKAHHGDAFIVGNEKALLALKEALTKLLDGKGLKSCSGARVESVGAFTGDGEGFSTFLILQNREEAFDVLQLPYTLDYAIDDRDLAVTPAEHIKDVYRMAYEKALKEMI